MPEVNITDLRSQLREAQHDLELAKRKARRKNAQPETVEHHLQIAEAAKQRRDALRSQIEGMVPPRKEAVPKNCICGCGLVTKGGDFMPGHDAKLKSLLVRVVSGKAEESEIKPLAMQYIEDNGWVEKYATPATASAD